MIALHQAFCIGARNVIIDKPMGTFGDAVKGRDRDID
jgi:hypothetical protein